MAGIRREDAAGWLEAYGKAWETGDADAIVELFSQDASYRETPFDPPMIGHDAIRAYWLEEAARHRDVHFAFEIWAVVGDQGFSNRKCRFLKDDRGLELDGAFRLVFQQDHGGPLLCRILEEWWHLRPTAG